MKRSAHFLNFVCLYFCDVEMQVWTMFAHNKALMLKLVFRIEFFFYIQDTVYVASCHEGGTLSIISSATTHINTDSITKTEQCKAMSMLSCEKIV